MKKKVLLWRRKRMNFINIFAIVYLVFFFFSLLVVKKYFWVFVQCLLINTFHYCLECCKHSFTCSVPPLSEIYYQYEISLICKMQLEDDVIAKPGYFSIMKTFAEQQSSSTWVLLEFSTLGFIGIFEIFRF